MNSKAFRWIAAVLFVGVVLAVPALAMDEPKTWSDTLREKIDSLNLTDAQKTDIKTAFIKADDQYDMAIADTRATLAKTLTPEQKEKLGAMADNAIQKRLEGSSSHRSMTIDQISKELGITESQSKVIKDAFKSLGKRLDKVDSGLVSQVKKVLDKDQLAKVKSWL